jgi:hypothetical protein
MEGGYALSGATPFLVLSRPLRAAFAVASAQPGERSAARQTPHIPFFFQKNGDLSV